MTKQPKIAFKSSAWAAALGREHRTLQRQLAKAGIEVKPRRDYTAREIFEAVHGDIETAKLQKLNTENEILKAEQREKDEKYMLKSEVEKHVAGMIVQPLRNHLLTVHTELDAKCNPHDPAIAQTVLQQWADGVLAQCLAALPQRKDGK